MGFNCEEIALTWLKQNNGNNLGYNVRTSKVTHNILQEESANDIINYLVSRKKSKYII